MFIAGTGHRPDKLGGYSLNVFQNLVEFATQELSRINKVTKIDEVLSGMALGWDQALCQACITLDIPYTACIPFFGFEKRWPDRSQNYYKHLVANARAYTYISQEAHIGAYQQRNEYMVNHSHLVLALWNGTPGGTKNCIDYATKIGKPVENVWDSFEKFIWENR